MMSRINPALSRRRLIGGGVAAIAVSASSAAIAAQPMLRPWDELRQRFEAVRAEMARYEQATYNPARDEFDRLVGEAPPLTCDLVAKSGAVSTYSYRDGDWYPGLTWFEPVRELARAHQAYDERYRQASERPAWCRVATHMRELDDREMIARNRLMQEPAPDAQALAYKLGLALEDEELIDADRVALATDVERLA